MASLDQYQQKTEKQHILENPDTYTGSIENVSGPMYIFKDGKIQLSDIDYNPALYKLFDEAIVNCADHIVRTKKRKETIPSTEAVTNIHVEIKDNIISMTNNGDGIDIEMHPVLNMYIPQMIFTQLRTSTNYDKEEKKITGGKNGFGVKLVFIWSKWGKIETIDAKRSLKYVQEFENNLAIHLTSPLYLSYFFAKNVIAKKIKNAQIINMLDKNIARIDTAHFYYLLSKKFHAEFTKMLALEVAPYIRVNGIAPGYILPEKNVSAEYVEKTPKLIPLQKIGNVKNIVQTLEFLLENDFINGQILSIDGGASLNHAG